MCWVLKIFFFYNSIGKTYTGCTFKLIWPVHIFCFHCKLFWLLLFLFCMGIFYCIEPCLGLQCQHMKGQDVLVYSPCLRPGSSQYRAILPNITMQSFFDDNGSDRNADKQCLLPLSKTSRAEKSSLIRNFATGYKTLSFLIKHTGDMFNWTKLLS